ncbi:MAG TPA: hypothetical protein PKA28_11590 [Methylomusa anaerophila]|uniref:Uncharacterized protein n=1 Tax=Methylomusa anaerophila TaxID=1930071 RepID=A0A348AFM8_9FIRM|nr:hypothetical protein [Methylomusa anaerophila]BBB89876.1 hypothetical protein MAMMFC1_00516 [Methylomusa anaerophila]HML89077.1 hypothetical protein [Methylomusa anaerophila]
MRAIVSKDFFLSQTIPIKKIERITLSAYGGELAGTSIGSAETFRMPSHVLEPGQVFLTSTQWCNLLARVQNWPASLGVINFPE